jgi:Sec-independent protein translocase protein TatA
VNLLGRITSALLGPQQTLREFARENGRVLGAAASYFTELTAMVERQLYSKHSPTEADVETSRQLSVKMEEETKQAAVTVSPDPGTEEESKYEGF